MKVKTNWRGVFYNMRAARWYKKRAAALAKLGENVRSLGCLGAYWEHVAIMRDWLAPQRWSRGVISAHKKAFDFAMQGGVVDSRDVFPVIYGWGS